MQLFNELLAEIDLIPAIDVHTHVAADSPSASDLAEIALCSDIQAELESAGAPSSVLEIEDSGKRAREALQYMARIKNTSTYWCLTQILTGLYDTGSPLHDCDFDSLWEKVSKTAGDPGWAAAVLERAAVSTALVSHEWHRPLPTAAVGFALALRIDSLVNEAHLSRTLDRLSEATGQSVYEIADLKKAVVELFRRAKDAGAVAAVAQFDPAVDFEEGSRDAADRVLSLVLLGQKVNREDRRALRSYVLDLSLAACAEQGMPFQLMLGIKRRAAQDASIAGYEPGISSMYADLVSRHSQVTFDLFAASAMLNHELTALSRNYENVLVSGSWWYMMFPTHLRRILRERAEMLPITKSCGFASDARCAEWVYGRSRLLRREMAFALSQLVSEGYLSKGTAVDAAIHYLSENPRRVYGIE